MKIEDARKIIQEESLQGYNLCEERENRENEVVLKKENEKWIVYVTDERASKITNSVDKYNTETEAIEDFQFMSFSIIFIHKIYNNLFTIFHYDAPLYIITSIFRLVMLKAHCV